MTTKTGVRLQYLYLIATGNNDSIYKIGISHSPSQRLEQIKHDYKVPRAYIVEYMDVATRDEVFAIENALHVRFDDKRSTKYSGREWFELTEEDITDLRSLYQENSDGFAQARAFYSLVEEIDSIKSDVKYEETERQKLIRINRVNGKVHDTSLKGVLKRNHDLNKKVSEGILGKRFRHEVLKHPIHKACEEATNAVTPIVDRKVKHHALIAGAVGAVAGIMIGGAVVPNGAAGLAVCAGFIGLFNGGISGLVRTDSEKSLISSSVKNKAYELYPNTWNQNVEFLIDQKENKSLLIKDFSESSPRLRQEPAMLPRIDLMSSVAAPLKEKFENKNYFPKVATALTLGFVLVTSSTMQGNEKNTRYSAIIDAPIVRSI